MNEDFQRLLTDITHPDSNVRIAALDAIGQWDATHDTDGLSASAVPHVVTALSDAERDVRWAAAYALGALGYADGIPALLDGLEAANGDDGLRLVIVKALGKIGSLEAAATLESLARARESRCLRAAASRSLARLGA